MGTAVFDHPIPAGATALDVAGLAVDAAEGLHWHLASWLFAQAGFRADTGEDLARFAELSDVCADYAREVRP